MIRVMAQLETITSPYLASAFANDRAHVFHSWSAQGSLNPTVIAGALGSRMWDDKGNRWLDFSSQLVNVNIGHQHPKLVAAIQEQAARMCTIAPFHATTPTEECERALEHLRNVLMVEGPRTIAAIVLETVVGTNGILVPPDGYLAGVRKLCDEHGIVMICDEVMAGFGRCGEWFAVDRWKVTPDLITFAKGSNSGYIPVGGVIIKRKVADTYRDRVFPGGLTYSGHPLACASIVASIGIFKEEKIVENARRIGSDAIGPELAKIAAKHPSVGEVRGLGVFWCIELVRDRTTREPLV